MAGKKPNAGVPTARVILARIGAPHGVRGEVRVKTFTHEPMALSAYGPLATGEGRVLEVEALRSVGASPGMLVVRFKGIVDRDSAAALTGAELGVARGQLAPPEDEDEFYQADLVGLDAIDLSGETIGRVTAVLNFGAGDLLEIKPAQGESFLLAFTRGNVPLVDIVGGKVTIVQTVEVGDEAEEGSPGDA